MNQDIERNKALFNVPDMKPIPTNFFGPDGPSDKTGLARDFRCMRMLGAIETLHPEALLRSFDAAFAMMWLEERSDAGAVIVSDERLLRICLASGLSQEAATRVIAAIETHAVKEKLKANVSEALGLGAFGAPFIVVGDQIYFGSDRFEQLCFTHKLAWFGPDPKRPTVARL
jgi:2-hydroxychromene-2-carboxylate isomerase